ncbi:MAG: Mur ligase family protein, partial [Synergistota bacterium]|nr:Mur ligase family protein [Synergistota bacterium]
MRPAQILTTSRSRRSFPKGASVSIIGAGKSGLALAMAGERLDYRPFVSDSGPVSESARTTLESRRIPFEESGHTERILESDVVVLSSGISPRSKAVEIAISAGKPLMGELDFLCPFVKSRVLAVTGSNGKTTTVTLAGHLLERSGVKSAVAGNVGKPLADHFPCDIDVLVVELSSFQLFWAHSFPVNSAVITNIAPDHLDWHGSFEEYVLAKRKLVDLLVPGGSLVFQARDRKILEPFPENAKITGLR